MNKKGQFTILVIIGIIILVVIGLVIYINSNVSSDESEPEVIVEFAEPVRNYVNSCLKETTKEALKKSGLQGGYINVPGDYPDMIKDTSKPYLQNPPGSDVKIPYWYHLQGNCNNGCNLVSETLTLEGPSNSVESEVINTVEANLASCLNNFESINDVNVEAEGSPEVNVVFSQGEVIVSMDYPLRVSTEEEDTTIESFSESLDVDFKRLYDLAFSINYFFSDRKFIERKISQQVLSALSSGENPPIPPMYGQVQFGNLDSWLIDDVNQVIERQINDEVSKVTLEGSANSQVLLPVNRAQRQNQNLVLPFQNPYYADIPFRDLEVDFKYLPWWDLYLDISGNGASSEFVIPQPLNMGPLSFIIPPIADVNYFYDVSYPILVSITQPSAFNGEGFTFQFAYESNLRNNRPINSSFETVFLEGVEEGGTYLCAPDQRNSGLVNITVNDFITHEPVEDTEISYLCGDEICGLGVTNDDGEFSARFTICGAGTLQVSRTGYMTHEELFSTNLDSESELQIDLLPEIEIKGKVLKRMLTKELSVDAGDGEVSVDWILTSGLEDLEMYEQAILVMTNQEESDYTRVLNYNYTLTATTIDLIPGNYTLEAFVIKDLNASGETVEIPERRIEIPDYNPFSENEEVVIEAIEFNDSILVGGAQLEDIEITAEDLQKEYINFYVVGFNPDDLEFHEDLSVLEEFNNVSMENRNDFLPTFTDS